MVERRFWQVHHRERPCAFFSVLFLVCIFVLSSCASKKTTGVVASSEKTLSNEDYFSISAPEAEVTPQKAIHLEDKKPLNVVSSSAIDSRNHHHHFPNQEFEVLRKSADGRSISSLPKKTIVYDMDQENCCNCGHPSVCDGEKKNKRRFAITAKSLRQLEPNKIKAVEDFNLNRFYFLRSCDTPESLSVFIFGTKEMAPYLKKWNSGISWSAGEKIYFKTPLNNSDEMKNFFSDHIANKKYYVVQKGDNLKNIAHKVYGDFRSWKEIAARNSIQSPDQIKQGQKIILEYK